MRRKALPDYPAKITGTQNLMDAPPSLEQANAILAEASFVDEDVAVAA